MQELSTPEPLHTKDFGAVADGRADDSAALQKAIVAASSSHKTLMFDPGTYVVGSPLVALSGADWTALPGTVSVRSTKEITLISAVSVSDLHIRGLSLVGNNTDGPLALFVGYRSSNIVLDECSFMATKGMGAIFSNVSSSTVTDCNFNQIGIPDELRSSTTLISNARPAVAFTSEIGFTGEGNTIRNSDFSYIGLDAVSTSGQHNLVVNGNTMLRLTTAADWLNQPAGGAGVYSWRNSNVIIAHNTISGASGNGVDVAESQDVTIVDNDIMNSGQSGILISDTQNVNVDGNLITNSNGLQHLLYHGGISVYDQLSSSKSSAGLSISRNKIGNLGNNVTQMYGVQLLNTNAIPDLAHNVFFDNLTADVASMSVNSTISLVSQNQSTPGDALPSQLSKDNAVGNLSFSRRSPMKMPGSDKDVTATEIFQRPYISTLFDPAYYLLVNKDVALAHVDPWVHYDTYGWKEGRQPSLTFDSNQYLIENPDVNAASVNPVLHYVTYGWFENRDAPYVGKYTTADLLVDPNFLFQQLPSIKLPNGANILKAATENYADYGWQNGLNPDIWFDTNYYLQNNPDVCAAHVNPLLHYEQFGWREGRNPSSVFSGNKYLAANPDVKAAGLNPLLHYVSYGLQEGRMTFATTL